MTGECQHCGASVSKSYVRVMSADGVDAVHGCPNCEARPAGRQGRPERRDGTRGGAGEDAGERVPTGHSERREPDAASESAEPALYTDGGKDQGGATLDAVERDGVILYATATTDKPREEITEEWLAERFPDADFVEAKGRAEQRDYFKTVGEEPYPFVCPECGEDVYTCRTVDGTAYYRHSDNKDCDRDSRDINTTASGSSQATMSWERRLATIAIGMLPAVGLTYLMAYSFPSIEVAANGETTAITGPDIASIAVVAVLFAGILTFAMPYLPGKVMGGRR